MIKFQNAGPSGKDYSTMQVEASTYNFDINGKPVDGLGGLAISITEERKDFDIILNHEQVVILRDALSKYLGDTVPKTPMMVAGDSL